MPAAAAERSAPGSGKRARGRSPGRRSVSTASHDAKKADGVRVVVWNVERGLQLDAVVGELCGLGADVLLLQELDILCERTKRANVAEEIASALRAETGEAWTWVWACEFEELESPLRCGARGDDEGQGGGVHGNAILSRYPIVDAWSFQHRHVPFDWNVDGGALGEPRKGGRVALAAVIEVGAAGGGGRPSERVLCYTAHVENFCGPLGRYLQFAEILRDARERRRGMAVIVGGDINTLSTGIPSCLATYFDTMRPFGSGLFGSEAAFWERRLLLVPRAAREWWEPCELRDPFDKDKDVTVVHTGLRAKLDWLLLDASLTVRAQAMGGFGKSDHMWVSADVVVGDGKRGM